MAHVRSDRGGLQRVMEYKGMKHSMHRKDGEEGEYKDEKKGVEYEEKEPKDSFTDLGEKYEAMSPPRDKKHYPSVCLDASDFPALAKAKVGETVTLTVRAKIVGASQREDKTKVDLELREASLGEK